VGYVIQTILLQINYHDRPVSTARTLTVGADGLRNEDKFAKTAERIRRANYDATAYRKSLF